MEIEEASAVKESDADKATTEEEGKEDTAAAEAEPESSSYEVSNPARVVPAQLKYMAFSAGTRWEPLRRGAKSGIVLLRDLRPGTPLRPYPMPLGCRFTRRQATITYVCLKVFCKLHILWITFSESSHSTL